MGRGARRFESIHIAMASDRLRTPNIRKILSSWKRILRGDRFNRAAISLSESSIRANSSICFWRGVSFGEPGAGDASAWLPSWPIGTHVLAPSILVALYVLRPGVGKFDGVRRQDSASDQEVAKGPLSVPAHRVAWSRPRVHSRRWLPLLVVFLSRPVTVRIRPQLSRWFPARYALRYTSRIAQPVVGLADLYRVKRGTLMEGGTEYRSVRRASVGWPELQKIAMTSPYRLRRLWRAASCRHRRL